MLTTPNRSADALRDAVASYVDAIDIPPLDERAIGVRRATLAVAQASRRPLLRSAAIATAAAVALCFAFEAPSVVAGVQRVFAAFTVDRGRTVPMNVREVDLAQARADVPFAIVVPPALAGTTTTLREVLSPASPASDMVAFDLETRRPGPGVSIVESRDGGGSRAMLLSVRESERANAQLAPLPPLPKRESGAGPKISLEAKVGTASFVPLTWVTHGTRIVLVSPPGLLSAAQIRTIRSAMSR
jgi:hypothetical protein